MESKKKTWTVLNLNRSHVSNHTRIRLSRFIIDTFKILIPLIFDKFQILIPLIYELELYLVF